MKKLFQLLSLQLLLCMAAHAQAYEFMGLTTGQTKAEVVHILRMQGYSVTCKPDEILDDVEYCDFKNNVGKLARKIRAGFDGDRFDGMNFEFKDEQWREIQDLIVSINGKPTKPLHAGSNPDYPDHGWLTVEWNDRQPCPCEGMSLIKQDNKNTFSWMNGIIITEFNKTSRHVKRSE